MFSMNPDSVQALAAVFGTIVALLALFVPVLLFILEYKNQLKQQKIAQIRQELRTIVKDSADVLYRLQDGICLTTAAAEITKELKSRLSQRTTHEEILRCLENEQLMKSVAIQGWTSSRLIFQIEDGLSQLKQNETTLDGQLRVVAEAVKFFTNFIRQKCSPEVFSMALHAASCSEYYQKYGDRTNTIALINELTTDLQKVSIDICLKSYRDPLQRVEKLISNLSESMIDLSDGLLIKISESKFTELTSISEKPPYKQVAGQRDEDDFLKTGATTLVDKLKEFKKCGNSIHKIDAYITDAEKIKECFEKDDSTVSEKIKEYFNDKNNSSVTITSSLSQDDFNQFQISSELH